MMKSFRKKRLSGSSDTSSSKHAISRITSSSHLSNENVLQTPRFVIKALYDYLPQGPDELPFKKGDFFHVLGDFDENEQNGWYEATNPMTHAKGMVPMTYFETFNRSRPKTDDNQGSPLLSQQHRSNGSSYTSPIKSGKSLRNSTQTLYAVVLYEFKAERDDELDISPGENLIICAHHDYEWFIAKPINRLGGPGLVPAQFVKIVDLINPANNVLNNEDNLVKIIDSFKIPSVEQWKDQTAKYQASTIPLGSISNQAPPVSSNTRYFQNDGNNLTSNRSSLSSSNTAIVEASVDSYQLDHGRYQYLIIAKLSNGKIRNLYRYYQDFYDLQVKLLELFPFEAGKIENSKRIIPSIPGPLINVNDSISKLRREKLDYYLRNLIGLPSHISRSEEVLRLFDVLDNGFDKEVADPYFKQRQLKPISQKSNYQQDRLSQYSNLINQQGGSNGTRSSTTPTSSDSNLNRLSQSSGNLFNNLNEQAHTTPANNGTHPQPLPIQQLQQPIHQQNSSQSIVSQPQSGTTTPSGTKIKVKFYFKDDIFVLLLPSNLRLEDLKTKLYKRLNLNENSDSTVSNIRLYLKNDLDDLQDETNTSDYNFNDTQQLKLNQFEIIDDDKFHEILYDKCKLCILA